MKAAIYIVLNTKPGTSTTAIPLAEKLDILKKCYDSCRHEGLSVALVAGGDAAGVEQVRAAIPNTPLHGVWGEFDRQRGECALGLRILEEAERSGVEWIVKIAGDTYHPAPGWATKTIEAGIAAGADLVATMHHRSDWVTTQCYAVRPEFMRRTFPPMDADYGRIGIEAQWGERIAAAGLDTKWLKLAPVSLAVDGCENLVPAAPELTYLHAHCAASAAAWKKIDSSVVPDLKLKISIVIPARNEVQVNPYRGNVPLLTDTFNSIRDTSPADNLPECVLVDDGSNEALPAHGYAGPIRVIRNETSLGVDPSRNIGIQAATGDVIGVIDGHMRVETQEGAACQYGLQKLATLARDRQAIVVARCAHLELPAHRGPPMCGGVLLPLPAPRSPLAMGWGEYYPPDGVRRVNGLFGASYFAPREIWRRLQYFVNDCRCWGYSEEGLSIKAAFCDVPIFYCGDVTLSHWFRSNGPHVFGISNYEKFLNRVKVLKVIFSEKAFTEVWLPRCRASTGEGLWQPGWDAELQRPALLEEHARFQAVKVKTDAEILRDIFKAEFTA